MNTPRNRALRAAAVAAGLFWVHALGPVQSGGAVGEAKSPNGGAGERSVPHTIREDMQPIDLLLLNHDKISYTVTLIRGGVRTVTSSKDKDLVRIIQVHAREMKARMEQGNVIRPDDPVFRELFRHHGEIRIQMHDIPNGVAESETSANPQVVLLIRAHASTVAEFVRDGMPRARKVSPLPPGYRQISDAPSKR